MTNHIQRRKRPFLISAIGIRTFILAAIFLSSSLMIYAQQKPPQKPDSTVKYTEVKYSADTSSYRWQGNDRILILSGNVKFVQGDTILTADKVEYHEESKIAAVSGNLKVSDGRTSAVGNSAVIYFKDKKASIIGDVTMTIKPKPVDASSAEKSDQKSSIKADTTITCQALDYFYKDKRLAVPGAVKITQESRIITANSASYSDKDEILELNGNVKLVDEKEKHNFTSPKVRVSLRDDSQWVEAEKASGVFYIKEEKENTPAAPEQKTP